MIVKINSKVKSLGGGVILSVLSSILARGLGLIANFALIKILSPSMLGKFLGIQALVFIGTGFCSLGLSNAYRQIVSRKPHLRKRLLGSSLLLQSLMLMAYFICVMAYLDAKQGLDLGVMLVAAGSLLVYWPDILNMDLYMAREYKKAAVLNVFSVFGVFLAACFVYIWQPSFFKLALGYFLGIAFWAGLTLIAIKPKDLSCKLSMYNYSALKVGLPFSFSLIVSRVGLYFGLSYILSSQHTYQAGIIGFTVKIYQVLLLTATTTTNVTVPHFHALSHSGDFRALHDFLRKLVGPLWVVGGCFAGAAIIAPHLIIKVFASNQYMESAKLLPVAGVAFLFKSLSIPAGDMLEGRKRQWLRVAVQIVSSFIIVVSTIFLYPKYGPMAVVSAMLTADIVSFILLWGINAVELGKYIPWEQHILALMIFAVSVALWAPLHLDHVAKLGFFLLLYTFISAWAGLWQPKSLIKKYFRND
ncbi:MAG: hypothetical protein P1U40_08835 [Coxiellaceae bacterium]|nr:hypothetical protein [Coxiellaceae bacterium]